MEVMQGLEHSDAIRGWEVALPTMLHGERAELTLQPSYAFGAAGFPPRIPPNATVVCDLTLVNWTSTAARRTALAERYTQSTEPEEAVYDKYRAELEAGNMSQVAARLCDQRCSLPAALAKCNS